MNENIRKVIDYAAADNIADMQSAMETAIQSKIVDALEAKRIEVAQSFMNTNEAYRPDPSDYVPDDNSEPDFKGHMDDHPNYKRVGGYGKYRAFGVHEYTGNTLGAVPYIASDANGDAIFKGDRKGAHNAAKTAALKANPVKESYIGEESLTKGKRLVSTHGEGIHTAKVYYDPEWEEHQVHYYKNGKHMGEGPVSYHSGNGRKEDKQEAQDSAEAGLKWMNKTKNESYIGEKLSVSDGVSAWIKDFVHSDDPRFEGKSKEERRQMALGAYYAAKKGTNEEVEALQEISKKTLGSYVKKSSKNLGDLQGAIDYSTAIIRSNDPRDEERYSISADPFRIGVSNKDRARKRLEKDVQKKKNRETGIDKAVDRLSRNEEVDE